MAGAQAWQNLFENWPSELPKNGQIVTAYAETIKFVDFLLGDGLVFIERDRPDSFGARKVMITYDAINAVKLESAVELEKFKLLGFR